jgi:hypothetical protein
MCGPFPGTNRCCLTIREKFNRERRAGEIVIAFNDNSFLTFRDDLTIAYCLHKSLSSFKEAWHAGAPFDNVKRYDHLTTR